MISEYGVGGGGRGHKILSEVEFVRIAFFTISEGLKINSLFFFLFYDLDEQLYRICSALEEINLYLPVIVNYDVMLR